MLWKADEEISDEWLLVAKGDVPDKTVDLAGSSTSCVFCPDCGRLWIAWDSELSRLHEYVPADPTSRPHRSWRGDKVRWAKASLAEGRTLDEVADELVSSGLYPIAAIKILREAAGIHLGEAKAVVHRNLPLDQQRAAEQLWDEAIEWLETEE